MNKKIGCLLVSMLVFQWSSVYWLGVDNLNYAIGYASLNLMKPFVYRQLAMVPVRMLEIMGLRIDWAIVIVMTCAGVGFYLSLRQLTFMFYPQDKRGELSVVFFVVLGLCLFGDYRMPYDLFTAWLFTLAFLYIYQDNRDMLAVTFVLACLNRETAFLIIILTAASMGKGRVKDILETVFIQGLTFILIQFLLHFIFRNNGGAVAWIEPWQNLQKFILHPVTTLLHFAVAGVMSFAIGWQWAIKPLFLRTALIVLLPIIMLMYLFLGQAFEVRVFWEVYPIMALLMFPTVARV